ncbi:MULTISPECIES: NucA/NucB deoxyribonuclease domain-containing protein [unclassified Streptomyces]|uniref:NucA/NucB deoxyribonuclease domain-containing protein n=1 Tax=unclassified Streptomyces TaxID=2593676 RepID=UPI002E29E32F|nr:NucA/NucB deoxyribonuclease domain-containing protein [Streptomyces sp. NBC_00228]
MYIDNGTSSPHDAFQRLKEGAAPQSLGLTRPQAPALQARRTVRTPQTSVLTGPPGMQKDAVSAPGAGHVVAGPAATQADAVSPKTTTVPPRTLTLDECKAQTATGDAGTLWLKSRFAVCQSLFLDWEWIVDGEPVGFTQVTATGIGTVPSSSSRELYLNYYLSDFVSIGTNDFQDLLLGVSGEVETFPSTATLSEGGLLPDPQTIANWEADPSWMVSFNAPVGQGYAPDDGVWSLYNVDFPFEPAPGWIADSVTAGQFASFGLRWDNAPYLPNYKAADPVNSGGAEFSYLVAPLQYSTAAGAPERAAAQHIQQAFTSPQTTYPANPAKDVPGDSADQPLHRLYYDTARREANRNAAGDVCEADDPNYGTAGLDCDEFPFATTYEGAAQHAYDATAPADNFSAKMIDSAENQAGGSQLGVYYGYNRIIDGNDDAFYLEITP